MLTLLLWFGNFILRWAFAWLVFNIVVQDTGLHYDHYLREVIDFLEKDEHFREKLRNTDMEDIKVTLFKFLLWLLLLSVYILFVCHSKASWQKSWTLSVITSGQSWMS